MTPKQLIDRGYIPDGDISKLSTLGKLSVNFIRGSVVVRYGLNYVDILQDGSYGHNPPCIETILLYKDGEVVKYIETAFNRFCKKHELLTK